MPTDALTDQIAQVRALAEECHAACEKDDLHDWRVRFGTDVVAGPEDDHYTIAECNFEVDAAFIAANNPAFALAVLARLDAAERQVATMRAAVEDAEVLCQLVRDFAGHEDVGKCWGETCAECYAYGTYETIRAALAPQPASGDLPPARSHGATGVLTSTDMSQTVAPSESRSESAGGQL